jgi:hypothetical protein
MSLGQLIHQRLIRGYENPERLSGVIQFRLTDSSEKFYLTFNGPHLELSEGESPDAKAWITMSAETAKMVAVGPNLDLASEENWEKIQTDGDILLIGTLAQMTKLPRSDAAERFRLCEENAKKHPPVTDVLRLSKPPASLVREMIDIGQPMIISEVIADLWPQGFKLDLALLREKYGATAVRTTTGSMLISEVIDRARAGDPDHAPYTFGAPAPPELVPLFPPPFLDRAKFGPAQIWLGSASGAVSTPLHRDSAPAFLGQIVGRKEWIIISPDQTENAYARKSYNRDQPCWVDAWDPDYDKYSRYRDVRALRFMLHPGEMTIIPPGWFHTVKALDVTFSIGFHYDPVADFGYVLD